VACLAVAVICDLFVFETDLYKLIKYRRCTVRILGVLAPFLWLGLSMTVSFSDRAFVNSDQCNNLSFKDWLLGLFFFCFFMDSILIPPDQVQPLDRKQLMGQPLGPGFSLAFGSAFGLCLFRRRS
jgi:hypothetical protein